MKKRKTIEKNMSLKYKKKKRYNIFNTFYINL